MIEELTRRAHEVAKTYEDIALVLLIEPGKESESGILRICLVMKDGGKAPWFAEGKGIEGLAYQTVPGRDVKDRILADPRLALPGLQLYMNFCDPRALMFTYADGNERLAGAEIADIRYRILYPEPAQIPPLEEFFYLWGAPVNCPDRARS
jgi:hypothetical protein